ncbi:hypothetical protein CR513_60103 [Mucuna pruriens]|uniref:DUF3700 domain-containing protein n=1 Tax=Mucuna pruriens TaxID=157652 RepID=A0A371E6K7_MUCPR|nr:hypothetical protein CR513_60103 [Mucuna pruriens]
MLGIFKEKLVNAPKELKSPASLNSCTKAKASDEIIKDFMSCYSSNAFSMCFGTDALLAYSPSNNPSIHHHRKEKCVTGCLVGSNGQIGFYWGIAADGSIVISEDLELIKASCAKSFAPFPTGCMFHSEHGLMSFEHPTKKMKAMPRIDSEGVMCGANFNVDSQSKIQIMPRVGSEANWATWN